MPSRMYLYLGSNSPGNQIFLNKINMMETMIKISITSLRCSKHYNDYVVIKTMPPTQLNQENQLKPISNTCQLVRHLVIEMNIFKVK